MSYWTYVKEAISSDYFDKFYPEVLKLCKSYVLEVNGKEYESKRRSCVFAEEISDTFTVSSRGISRLFSYSHLPYYEFNESLLLTEIKEKIEEITQEKFDLCLVHIYPDGNAGIGWHNDKEALNSVVASVSLGVNRKFRFRRMSETRGWEKEFVLGSGDLVVMLKGCQRAYKHTVPIEKRVKSPRINLTFRQTKKT